MNHETPTRGPLEEAYELVHGSRQDDYGHPRDHWTLTAKLWSAFLGIEIPAAQVGFLFVLDKVARCHNAIKPDSLVDIAGYAEAISLVLDSEGS